MPPVSAYTRRARARRKLDTGALPGALADLCADLDPCIDVEQWVPQPPEAVFPFYADARNLERITPPFLRFRVLSTADAALRDGTLIDHRLAPARRRSAWRKVIESWRPDEAFIDRQLRGLSAHWRHLHVRRRNAGGTLVRDRVRYRLPFGALGDLLAGRLVRRDLART
ncbi:MAG: SRPBCC family protein [Candidatus Binatia bacterium]